MENYHTLALPSNSVHLWFCHYEDITDSRLIAAYDTLLEPYEKEQQRLKAPKDRHQFLITRTLIRTVLSKYDPTVSPSEWRFTKNQYGRPKISPDMTPLPIRFNLTHTKGLIVCGVTLNIAIGVDVEDLSRQTDRLKIAQRYFSPTMTNALEDLPERQQQQRFFEYWTLSEAYLKGRGIGLFMFPRQFSFHLAEDSSIRLSVDSDWDENPTQWQFLIHRINDTYQLAVAVKTTKSLRFKANNIIPLDCVESLPFPGRTAGNSH